MISHNPYRLLGVFANDSLRDRTANTAKMRAFFKIGKSVNFNTDTEGLFGELNRTQDSVHQATDVLFDNANKVRFALFWFHKNNVVNEATISQINATSYHKFIVQDSDVCSYSYLINNAVLALAGDEYDCAVKNYSKFIDDEIFLDNFKEEIGFVQNEIANETIIRILITALSEDYSDVEWWPLFFRYISKVETRIYVQSVFVSLAIEHIKRCISSYSDTDDSARDEISSAHSLKRETISDVRLLCRENEDSAPSAEAQLALDKLAEELLSKITRYYNAEKQINEQSVFPTLQMVNYIMSLTHGSGIIEKATKFKASLQKDIDELPPASVRNDIATIKRHISDFCAKSDDIQWSLLLVKDCVPSLLNIKATLTSKSKHYIAISTKIADNAIYNLDVALEHLNNGDMPFVTRKNVILRQAWQLIVDLCVLDLDRNFVSEKLDERKDDVKDLLVKNMVGYLDIHPDISLMTEEDAYNECNDYDALVEFVKNHPTSQYADNAKLRIRKIEDADFPKTKTVSTLFAYKRMYPNSHNDSLVRQALYELLLADKYGTLNDYQTLLRLYPYNPPTQLAEILKRIDYLKFCQCHTILDYQNFVNLNSNSMYVNEANAKIENMVYESALKSKKYNTYLEKYPNGKYAEELRSKLEFRQYNACKTKNDYLQYVRKYPQGRYTALANNNIKRMNRRPLKYGFVIVLACLLIWGLASLLSNNDKVVKANTSHKSQAEQQAVTYGNSDEDTIVDIQDANAPSEYDEYIDNSLETGSKPYSEQLGKARKGRNYLTFKTSGEHDFVVIVKRASDNKYINHTYIRGGDDATLYLPNGRFNIFFYSGKGWNPDKLKGVLYGGFVADESLQKDGPINLHDGYGEYTLYPVENGNLQLQSADDDDAF